MLRPTVILKIFVAKRIVGKFGEDTLDIIEETPDELLKVPGIGKVRVDRIKTSWQEQMDISARKVSRLIKALKENGKIIRVGSDRKGYWKITQ